MVTIKKQAGRKKPREKWVQVQCC